MKAVVKSIPVMVWGREGRGGGGWEEGSELYFGAGNGCRGGQLDF